MFFFVVFLVNQLDIENIKILITPHSLKPQKCD